MADDTERGRNSAASGEDAERGRHSGDAFKIPEIPRRAPAGLEHLSALESFVAGAVAGAIAKTAVAPLSRLALIYQVDPSRRFSMTGALGTLGNIVRVEGARGLWRGHAATLWRVVPFAGVQFLVFDRTYSTVSRLAPPPFASDAAASAVAGAAAGATATLMTYPLDVLRARAAAHLGSSPRYSGYTAGVEAILRAEGVPGLFRGLFPTILGILPYGAVSFSSFAVLTRLLQEQQGADADVPVGYLLLAGGASGACAQFLAYPCNVVRRRMQVASSAELGAQGSLGYVNTRTALLSIAASEGFAGGLYKGASLIWVKGPVTVGLAFVVNDLVKRELLRERLALSDNAVLGADLQAGLEHAEHAEHKRQLSTVERVICGGVAGAIAKSVIAPADRIKILYQTSSSRVFSWKGVLRTGKKIVAETGLRGLWRGHVATLLRVVPYSGTTYATFDIYKARAKLYGEPLGVGDLQVRFIAGAAAGATATTLTYPLELLRARMAAHWGPNARYNSGYFAALRSVVVEEGPMALYSGLRPTLLGIVPYAGCSFMFFETFKAEIKKHQGSKHDRDIHAGARLGAGALAGLLAQSCTYPLDIIRRRMQVHTGTYRNEWDAVRTIVREEGARTLFKGLSMNWVKGPLAVGLSFSVNDFLRSELAK